VRYTGWGALADAPISAAIAARADLDHIETVAHVPSLAYLSAGQRAAAGRAGGFLGVGYETTGRDLPRLVNVREEVRLVSARYSSAIILLGAQATRGEVLRQLSQVRALHFAGHAVGGGTQPSAARLVVAGGAGQDGYLATSDLRNADLSRLEVAVLLACEAAAGGSFGSAQPSIATAFLDGGAGAVIGSSQLLDDRAGPQLAAEIHEQLARGTQAAAAVLDIQRKARGAVRPFDDGRGQLLVFDGRGVLAKPMRRHP
jgi:CHAT domain-containing protein